ncbi:hypothetical protein PMAYCL1PPCAC_19164, partial [Pristionchus mayeri]
CYTSDTPHLDYDRLDVCKDDKACFVEFFINNISGAPVHTYNRFCTQAAHCVRHNIPMNEDVQIAQLSVATQNAFYNLKSNLSKDEGEEFIKSTWFRCCDTNACNNIDLHSVKGKFGVWPSLNYNYNVACHAFFPLSLLILLR